MSNRARPTSIFILIAVLLWCSAFLISCTKEYPFLFRISGIDLHNEPSTGIDTAQQRDTIAAADYYIRMHYTTIIYGDDNTFGYESTSMLGTPAVAFNIYSLSDFDASHPPRSSLNDYFLYNSQSIASQLQDGKMFTEASYLRSNSRGKGDMSEGEALLRLTAVPSSQGYQQFVVSVVFKDSTKLADTVGVYLK